MTGNKVALRKYVNGFYTSEFCSRAAFWSFSLLILCLDLLLLRHVIFIGAFQISDINIPYFNLKQLSAALFSGWNFQGFGSPSGFNYFSMWQGYLAYFASNPGFAEKASYYLSIPLSSIFAYVMLRQFRIRGLWLPGLSILYQFSPWLIGEFMTGEPVMTWMIALFPLVVFCLLRITDNPSYQQEPIIIQECRKYENMPEQEFC